MNRRAKEKYNKRIKSILPIRCTLNGGNCSLKTDVTRRNVLITKQPYAFIIRPYLRDCLDMEECCKELIDIDYCIARNAITQERSSPPTRNDMAVILAKDESSIGHGYCQICSLCLYSYFGVAELGHLNPNVLLEVGLMFAFSKPVIFTLDTRLTAIDEVPFDINGILLVPYQNYEELKRGLNSKLSAIKEELKGQKII